MDIQNTLLNTNGYSEQYQNLCFRGLAKFRGHFDTRNDHSRVKRSESQALAGFQHMNESFDPQSICVVLRVSCDMWICYVVDVFTSLL